MIVLIDDREPADVVAAIGKHWPTAQVSRLQAGDVNIVLPTGLLAVERKTANDLLGSIGDGRLFEQAARMVKVASWPVVVVHNGLHYDHNDFVVINGQSTQWRGKAVRAALLAVQWAGCAVVIANGGPVDFASRVAEIVQLAQKPDHRHFERSKTRKPPIDFFPDDEAIRQRVEFIASIPGVGPTRARNLLDWVPGHNVAEALEWITGIATLHPKNRPPEWGRVTIDSVRSFLGLTGTMYLGLHSKDGDSEELSADPAASGETQGDLSA